MRLWTTRFVDVRRLMPGGDAHQFRLPAGTPLFGLEFNDGSWSFRAPTTRLALSALEDLDKEYLHISPSLSGGYVTQFLPVPHDAMEAAMQRVAPLHQVLGVLTTDSRDDEPEVVLAEPYYGYVVGGSGAIDPVCVPQGTPVRNWLCEPRTSRAASEPLVYIWRCQVFLRGWQGIVGSHAGFGGAPQAGPVTRYASPIQPVSSPRPRP
ncbi:MAG: hypothetical protein IT477_10575 [Rhodanobacteraceae bacterium]|nr:hypothetical protein [Rhodanobacteraceae bacterium]